MTAEETPTGNAASRSGTTLRISPELPGLPGMRDFRLMSDPAYSPPFEMLASEEDPDIGFYVLDPHLIDPEYAPALPPTDIADLMGKPGEGLALRVIVTVAPDPRDTTINLAAPLVLSLSTGLGRQVILVDGPYGMRAPLLPLLERASASHEETGAREHPRC